MIVATYGKQPYEEQALGIDFGPWLEAGVTITTATVTAKTHPDGQDATATLLRGAVSIVDGTTVKRLVVGGTDGAIYLLEFRAVDSNGHKHEAELKLVVTEV